MADTKAGQHVDPVTMMAIGNAIAGIASGLTEQTFSAAGGLIEKIHNKHKPTAAAHMTANISAFTTELNANVERLTESIDVIASRIEQPAFVIQLQSAMVSASQTASQDVHVLLAGLVSQGLRVETDTTAARACHRACQVIADLTSAQLTLLGFLYTLGHMPFPMPPDTDASSADRLRSRELEWVQLMLKPYASMTCTNLDRMNLHGNSCLGGRQGFLSDSFDSALKRATSQDFAFDNFIKMGLGAHLKLMYDSQGLGGEYLTSVGSVLGMFVADQLASRPNDLTAWDG
jgi:hypothetical protein